MPITIRCPACATAMAAPEEYAGKAMKCPKCFAVVNVPANAPSAPPPPVQSKPMSATASPPAPPAAAAKKSGNKLYLTLAGLGALMLMSCCCGIGIGWGGIGGGAATVYRYFRPEKNEKVTKENFEKLKAEMTQKDITLTDIEAVLDKGEPTTLEDVKAAYKNEKKEKMDHIIAEHAVMIDRKADYRWRNGDEFIFVMFNGSAADNGKAVYLAHVKPSGSETNVSSHGALPK
jgi:hypothetical protein